jgi:hypothetical protein
MTAAPATASVIRLRASRAAVWVVEASAGGWLALAGSSGWHHGSRESAIDDGEWLAQNFQLPLRTTT